MRILLFFQKIYNIVVNKIMARTVKPREIRLPHGKVSLTGFSTEESDLLAEHIKKFNTPTKLIEEFVLDDNIIEESTVVETSVTPVEEMTNKAVSLRYNDITNEYEIITLKYSMASYEGRVFDILKVGTRRRDAETEFKKILDKLQFIT